MKIEIKLSNDSLISINNLLKQLYEAENSQNKKEKVYRSIGFDLADKFDAKAKNLVKKSSLFDPKKKLKFTLKFHESWALEAILIDLNKHNSNDYQRTLIQKIINDLNQKLI